jgi:hypothetical protein
LNPAAHKSRVPRIYLDSSAYLCILLAQDGAERLAKETINAQLLSSVLLVLETKRNLVRLARERVIDSEQYKACMDRLEQDKKLFIFRDLTLDLCDANTLPAIATPSSLDLAHLRTALWFHASEKVDRFMSMDSAQQQAAKELGLPT